MYLRISSSVTEGSTPSTSYGLSLNAFNTRSHWATHSKVSQGKLDSASRRWKTYLFVSLDACSFLCEDSVDVAVVVGLALLFDCLAFDIVAFGRCSRGANGGKLTRRSCGCARSRCRRACCRRAGLCRGCHCCVAALLLALICDSSTTGDWQSVDGVTIVRLYHALKTVWR